MTNVIVIAILVLILGLAVRYIIKAKKSGAKCIGCSVGGCTCSQEAPSNCGCGSEAGSCCCHTDTE